MGTFQGAKGAPFLVGQPDNQSSFWMLEEYSSIKYFNLQHHGTSSIYCSLMMIRVFQFFSKELFLGFSSHRDPEGPTSATSCVQLRLGRRLKKGMQIEDLTITRRPLKRSVENFRCLQNLGRWKIVDFLQIFNEQRI